MPGRWAVAQAARGGGMAAPEQEPGEREEHRDRQIEAVQQPSDHSVGCSGLKGDVGQHHAHRGTGPHALDSRQEASRSADLLFHSSQCARMRRLGGNGYTHNLCARAFSVVAAVRVRPISGTTVVVDSTMEAWAA